MTLESMHDLLMTSQKPQCAVPTTWPASPARGYEFATTESMPRREDTSGGEILDDLSDAAEREMARQKRGDRVS